jgi:hypothetical protein
MRQWLVRVSLFGGIQGLAALVTLAGFALALAGDLSSTQRVLLGFATLLAVTLITVAALVLRRKPLQPVTREEMVATGERLLEHAVNHSVVLFAGDMSWAPEYRGAIAHAVNEGKTVVVLYPQQKETRARGNAEVLRNAGATVIAVSHDARLRAALIDHEDPAQALLYVVNKRRGTHATAIGRQPSTDEYEAKIYRWKEDALLINTATKLYQVLAPRASGHDEQGS